MKTLRSYGKFMPKGHGKDEYECMPCSEVVYKDGDSLYCNYYVNTSRTLYKSNLTASIAEGSLVSKPQKELHQHGDLSKVIYLSDSAYFAVKYNLNIGFKRVTINKNDTESPINIGNLNTVTVRDEINTLSACREVNKNNMMVVEAMLRFNQINLYSLRDSFNITLSMSPNLASITATDNLSKNQRRKYFGTVFTTDTYFATLYYDIPLRDYYEDQSGKSHILFFDWQGNPIMKIKIPYIATSFFIANDYLYVFTNITEKEQLYRYKLKIN